MRRCVAISLVCLSAAAYGCDKSPTTPSSNLTLRGTVTDRANGQPLSGATVKVIDGPDLNKSTTADGSGHYVLSGLIGPVDTVMFEKQYYVGNAQSLALTANTMLDFALDFAQPFTRSGMGNAVLDVLPPERRIRIHAQYTKKSSPFVVSILNDQALVNELLGTSHNKTTFDGIVVLNEATVVIETSSDVAWSFTEVR
jgi:hypothetical protein